MTASAWWRRSWNPRCRCCTRRKSNFVMAGLVPAIHVFFPALSKAMDAGDKPGHDAYLSFPVTLAHPGLDPGHAADPAVVVVGFLPHVIEHLRMRQDHERLLLDALQRVLRHLLRRQVAVAGLRPLRDRTQHVGVDPLRARD